LGFGASGGVPVSFRHYGLRCHGVGCAPARWSATDLSKKKSAARYEPTAVRAHDARQYDRKLPHRQLTRPTAATKKVARRNYFLFFVAVPQA